SPPKKINLISCEPLAHISDIKLIRTDTTLDLSQKAEKGMLITFNELLFYTSILTYFLTKQVMCTSSRISMMLEI
ncbi:Serine/threonine-protein kinase ZRK7, partial [Linum perenne]